MRTQRSLVFSILFLVLATFSAAWPWPRWLPELDSLVVRQNGGDNDGKFCLETNPFIPMALIPPQKPLQSKHQRLQSAEALAEPQTNRIAPSQTHHQRIVMVRQPPDAEQVQQVIQTRTQKQKAEEKAAADDLPLPEHAPHLTTLVFQQVA